MPNALINGVNIYYEDTGSNLPAVVLSHGFLMDHEMFAPQVAALKSTHRVITWDERGFGGTLATDEFTYWDRLDEFNVFMYSLMNSPFI